MANGCYAFVCRLFLDQLQDLAYVISTGDLVLLQIPYAVSIAVVAKVREDIKNSNSGTLSALQVEAQSVLSPYRTSLILVAPGRSPNPTPPLVYGLPARCPFVFC